MKKAIIGIVIAVLVIGLGAGGVLGYGYLNGKTDKTYAQNAKTLVSDFEKKYSDDYLDKQLNLDASNPTETDIRTAKTAIEQIKKDAENSLTALASKKSTPRVATIKQDSEDYFNLTIKAANNTMAYLNYAETLVTVADSLEMVGGEAGSLTDVIAEFQTAQDRIDDAVLELEKTTPPAGMEKYHQDMITALKEMSTGIGKMKAAISSGDLTALETYTNELTGTITKMVSLDMPSTEEITNNILSADETSKLNGLPGKISSEADQIANKKIVF